MLILPEKLKEHARAWRCLGRKLTDRKVRSPFSGLREKGAALVTVLCLMVLFVGLAVAVFFSAKIERRLSGQFSAGTDAQRLVDTAVNIVITQITDATGATNRAWVTQPGLIRTFTGNRAPDVSYRLYSADVLRVPGSYNPTASANAVPLDWWANPALFVDMNEPAPNAGSPTNADLDRYPIFYPPDRAASGTNRVAGYGVINAPVPTSGSIRNPVPMPVQWLYVLRDGTLAPGVASGSGQVRVDAASSNNPIVGRIAFWTDDECAKVNINTAAGGEFWSVPWFHTPVEQNPSTAVGGVKGFGFSAPVRNEFQRYPGHPYTTDLRAVFPELSREQAYEISPRVVSGGSSNGVVQTATLTSLLENDRARMYATVGELFFSTNFSGSRRLTALTNEIPDFPQLAERREAFLTAVSRAPELTLSGTPRVSIWPIHAQTNIVPSRNPPSYLTGIDRLMAFCSTISSGASRYPFYYSRTNSLSPTNDILLPRNQEIFAYLRRQCSAPPPGAGATSFTSKYGAQETDQILTQIFDYIRSANITDLSLGASSAYFNTEGAVVPTDFATNPNGPTTGFGRSLTVRQIGLHFICNASGEPMAPYSLVYTNGSATNTITGITRNRSNYPPGTSVTFTNVQVNGSPVASTNVSYSQIVPNETNFIAPNLALEPNVSLAPDQRRIQALLAMEFMSPSAGGRAFQDGLGGRYWHFRVKDLGNPTLGLRSTLASGVSGSTTNLDMSAQIGQIGQNLVSGGFIHPGMYGGTMPFKWIYSGTGNTWMRDLISVGGFSGSTNGFPYVSAPVTVNVNPADPTMNFSGASLAVDVWHPNVSTNNPVSRTIRLSLPSVSGLPVPSLEYATDARLMASATNWAFHYSGPFGTGGTNTNAPPAFNSPGYHTNSGRFRLNAQPDLVRTNDTLLTYVPSHGDMRLLFGGATNTFTPVPAGAVPNMRHMLVENFNGASPATNRTRVAYGFNTNSTIVPSVGASPGDAPAIPPVSTYPVGVQAPWTFGDWDTGSPMQIADGPLINKPDEGILGNDNSLTVNPFSRVGVYYAHGTALEFDLINQLAFITPNRQLPSAGMFGSLPTGVVAGRPWQTLLFRPDPGGHPGAQAPADHLLLDLFWMPIAEPYPISEPFSTAGKVNMNYQIVPFTYIERSTALRAVLMNEKIAHGPSVSNLGTAGYGKVSGFLTALGAGEVLRRDIDLDATLNRFQQRFAAGEVFISASEVTTMDLVPSGYASSADLWNAFPLTGENIKERPYATIYPRLTTKSNVYNVHYRVQVLRKRPNSDPQIWEENRDTSIAQRRGNTLVERFLDMNRVAVPDYALPANAGQSAETLYRFRVLSNQDFVP